MRRATRRRRKLHGHPDLATLGERPQSAPWNPHPGGESARSCGCMWARTRPRDEPRLPGRRRSCRARAFSGPAYPGLTNGVLSGLPGPSAQIRTWGDHRGAPAFGSAGIFAGRTAGSESSRRAATQARSPPVSFIASRSVSLNVSMLGNYAALAGPQALSGSPMRNHSHGVLHQARALRGPPPPVGSAFLAPRTSSRNSRNRSASSPLANQQWSITTFAPSLSSSVVLFHPRRTPNNRRRSTCWLPLRPV